MCGPFYIGFPKTLILNTLRVIQNLYISNQFESNTMSKDYTHIKANGIRNELKEIRKAVDKLTAAMIEIHLAQTNTLDETNNTKLCTCNPD
tara:strand:+ start:288 stop:560 length:273 start_codon:yes stop_codon:yes gene_type:complete